MEWQCGLENNNSDTDKGRQIWSDKKTLSHYKHHGGRSCNLGYIGGNLQWPLGGKV